MSNLIKSNAIRFNQAKQWVVDSNSREELFQAVSFRDSAVKLKSDGSAADFETEAGEFHEGLPMASMTEEELRQQEQEVLSTAEETANKLIAEAQAEAERILNDAKVQAEALSGQITESARQQGYNDGIMQGQQKVAEQQGELKAKIEKIQNDYEQKIAELEPEFVNLTAGLVERITGVLAEDKKDIILYLIRNIITGSERSKVYIIRASKEDFKIIDGDLENIKSSLQSDARIELYEDNTLQKNQCFIETDGSVIDCSLGTQTENLITELKLLSKA